MQPNHAPSDPTTNARRKSARRLAWVLAAVVVAIYVGFILSGALGK